MHDEGDSVTQCIQASYWRHFNAIQRAIEAKINITTFIKICDMFNWRSIVLPYINNQV